MDSEIKGKVSIVDDDIGVRDALKILLELEGYEAQAFGSAAEFLSSNHGATSGCALIDVRMPEIDGLRLLEHLSRRAEAPAVVMLTGFADVSTAVRAMREGAVDFVEKPFNDDRLLQAIDHALDTHQRTRDQRALAEESRARVAELSARELEVMTSLVSGASNKEAARDLGISPRTVEIHRSRIMEKTRSTSFAELVRIGLAVGISGTEHAR
ncbi:MAG: response regulator transcription factor [Geminicoccaceae bacterium]